MDCENGGYLTPHCKSCEYWLDGSWDFGCGKIRFNECRYLKPIEVAAAQHEYMYNGPVFIFEECVQANWRGKTKAVSEKKAYANLTYQWKKANGYAPNTKVILPGRVVINE